MRLPQTAPVEVPERQSDGHVVQVSLVSQTPSPSQIGHDRQPVLLKPLQVELQDSTPPPVQPC